MKVAITGSVGLPPVYGGFETLAAQIVSHLKPCFDFSVYCSGKSYEKKLESYGGAKLVYVPLRANGVQSILYDIVSILHALSRADVLLVLGVSGCIVLPFVKLISRKRIVVNIDGLEWKRDKWNRLARGFLKFSEWVAVRCADKVVADNAAIRDHVRRAYGKESHLIAYGGDHTGRDLGIDGYREEYPFLDQRYAFGICRIEPENNVHLILEAFAKAKPMPLVMVGNWNSSDYGMRLKELYGSAETITLLDAIYDQFRLDVLRSNCYLYLHGHSAGGTNPSLVEAMWLGLPIIAFDVSYNRETTENKARYFRNADDLVEVIKSMTPSLLSFLSAKMSEIAERNYRWDVISEKYAELFQYRPVEESRMPISISKCHQQCPSK